VTANLYVDHAEPSAKMPELVITEVTASDHLPVIVDLAPKEPSGVGDEPPHT
jgi:hypothetical protein